jgi:hypothetical protein
MKDHDAKLLDILKIGHDTSMRGEGISLCEALKRTHYKELRKTFGPNDLIAIVKAHPEISNEWIMYSEDKRTSGGWYLHEKQEIGQIDDPGSRKKFNSIEEAVSEYVVRELDFWASQKGNV